MAGLRIPWPPTVKYSLVFQHDLVPFYGKFFKNKEIMLLISVDCMSIGPTQRAGKAQVKCG